MAIRITRIDDVDGSDGAEAIAFELDGNAYEIDLCARNRIRFLRVIEPFVDRARVVEDGKEAPTISTIVRHESSKHGDLSEDSSNCNLASERKSQGLDLMEMAQLIQG